MNKQAADRIITEYLQKIYGFSMKKAFSYDEAEEICACIVEEVYRSLLRNDEIINIEGYIWRISEHTYSKYVSSKKRQEGISIEGMEIPFHESFSLENDDDEFSRLRREIAFLTEKRRRIVYLFYYEDRSISYISQLMDIPEGTVKWHLNKARNELKEGFSMERNIGRLGLAPITAIGFGHGGCTGSNEGPEYYLGDKLNLNIVYSVYHEPKTKEEIAEELGVTLVFIEDRIDFLEANDFLVRTKGNRYTTYVIFSPETYSLELSENITKKQLEVAKILAEEYVPLVRKAVADIKDVYIPGGNRELFEAAAVFCAVSNYCCVDLEKKVSYYRIQTTAGGNFVAHVDLEQKQSDPEYKATLDLPSYRACGDMNRWSEKYPAVYGWSIDSRYCSRVGTWKNNLVSDYEYLYEFMNGTIRDDAANADKFARLRERKFISDENKVNIMVVKGDGDEFFKMLPRLDSETKQEFAHYALEFAMKIGQDYPPQVRDMIVADEVYSFTGRKVALMVMDILYGNGVFRPLTENEMVTSQLIMFSDVLPE